MELTGSDALISALWKIDRGAIAFNMAMNDLASLAQHGKYSDDIYFHHAEALKRLAKALEKEEKAPPEAEALVKPYRYGKEIHFHQEAASKVSMWETHPSNREREINSKRHYLPVPPVKRPAWELFQSATFFRQAISRNAYHEVLGILLGLGKEPVPAAEIHQLILEEREEVKQEDRYFGFYSDRMIWPGDIHALAREIDQAAAQGTLDPGKFKAEALAWTGEPLQRFMERLNKASKVPESRSETEKSKKELDGLFALLPAGDAAIFRYFYYLSGRDGDGASEKRLELLKRYDFLLSIQEHLKILNPAEFEIHVILQRLQMGRELSSSEAAQVMQVFEKAWDALRKVAMDCDSLVLPKLSNLKEDETVRSFILPEDLIPPFDRNHLAGEWMNRFLRQFQEVLEKLKKLHYKNLGSLLRLQESLDPEFLGRKEKAPLRHPKETTK
ncbi:MAG: hypothetical protein HY717_16035 [Planctomycetes bacterium]|nr:hypothetical protein [Planctomycetota bacterium]